MNFFIICFTVTGIKKIIRYAKDFVIAAGHQPAAHQILERFEIFRSMVPWFDFNQSVTVALCSQQFA